MSDTTAAAQPLDPASGPLGQMLGLNREETDALGKIFSQVTRSMGIDGAPIFEKLREGKTLGQALGVPRGLAELLYARAHRWFSLGRIDKAEPLFRALCVLEEGSADHWVGYGVCLRVRGEPAQADTAFAAAAQLRPEWAIPHFHRLELAVSREDWPSAAGHLREYDQRASGELPEAIRTEAERLRAAVSLHQ